MSNLRSRFLEDLNAIDSFIFSVRKSVEDWKQRLRDGGNTLEIIEEMEAFLAK